MKSRIKKQEELKQADGLFTKSKALLFVDFSGINTSRVRDLRTAIQSAGGSLMVVKKRLLNVLFKEKGAGYDAKQFNGSVGTIFSENTYEETSAPVYKFFSSLTETETKKKADNLKKILGAYDVLSGQGIPAETLLAIGQLPSRDVLLANVLRAIAAPLQALMYLLSQKAKSAPALKSENTVRPEEEKQGNEENKQDEKAVEAVVDGVAQPEGRLSAQEVEVPTQTVEQ